MSNNSKIITIGDINIDFLNFSAKSSDFEDIITCILFLTIFYLISHFIQRDLEKKTWLDNYFISWPGFESRFIASYDMSDHLPILKVNKSSDNKNLKVNQNDIESKRFYTQSSISHMGIVITHISNK